MFCLVCAWLESPRAIRESSRTSDADIDDAPESQPRTLYHAGATSALPLISKRIKVCQSGIGAKRLIFRQSSHCIKPGQTPYNTIPTVYGTEGCRFDSCKLHYASFIS